MTFKVDPFQGIESHFAVWSVVDIYLDSSYVVRDSKIHPASSGSPCLPTTQLAFVPKRMIPSLSVEELGACAMELV